MDNLNAQPANKITMTDEEIRKCQEEAKNVNPWKTRYIQEEFAPKFLMEGLGINFPLISTLPLEKRKKWADDLIKGNKWMEDFREVIYKLLNIHY